MENKGKNDGGSFHLRGISFWSNIGIFSIDQNVPRKPPAQTMDGRERRLAPIRIVPKVDMPVDCRIFLGSGMQR
jgi:hypothetical protein